MKQIHRSDQLGLYPFYYETEGNRYAETIKEILKNRGDGRAALDPIGTGMYLNKRPDQEHTCFKGIFSLKPGHILYQDDDGGLICKPSPESRRQENLKELFLESVGRLLSKGKRAALALSGGLDSALVLSFVKDIGMNDLPVYTLATGWEGYCELDRTLATAKAMGIDDVRVIRKREADFIEMLPLTVNAAEVPLYNMHPVSKHLLARELKRDGIELILTGDGADQVFCNTDGADYIPVVGSIFRHEGVVLYSPFLDEKVMAFAEAQPPDPDKKVLRQLAADRIPSDLIHAPKQGRLAPEMDVSRYWNEDVVNEISAQTGYAVNITNDHDLMLWTTLSMLAEQMGDIVKCAGSPE